MILSGMRETIYSVIILWLILGISVFREKDGKNWIIAILVTVFFMLTVPDFKSAFFLLGMIGILMLNISKKEENFNTTNIITSLLAVITGVLFQVNGFDNPVMISLFVLIALEIFDAGMRFKERETAENKGVILKKLIESITTVTICLILLYIYLL